MYRQRSSLGLEIVLTTESNYLLASTLAKSLLQAKLAACVSLREIESYYYWDGKMEQSNEVQLIIKTTNDQLNKLLKLIEELHSFDTPELIHWPISCSKSYLDWCEASVGS